MLFLLLQRNWGLPTGSETPSNLLWCVGIIIATLLLKKPLAALLAKLSGRIAGRFTEKSHRALFSSLLHKPLELLLQVVLFYVALNQLTIILSKFILQRYKGKDHLLAVRFGDVVDLVFLFLGILFSTLLLSRIIDFVYRVQQDKAIEEKNNERQQLFPLLKDVAKLTLWGIGLFWILGAVFRVNIPALVTGLGIGGVAIALAAKESVENLFAAFTILTDKPFQTGNLIRLGNVEGHVERIGFRSTRLRHADGSAYIIPNKRLVMENVENLSHRVLRRVKTTIHIRYGMPSANLELVIQELQYIIKNTPQVNAPVEVLLNGFAEETFLLDVIYHLQVPLLPGTMLNVLKQEINMHIYEVVNKYTSHFYITNATQANNAQAQAGSTERDDDTST